MKYIICIYLVFFTIYASAQVPQRMSYQAVIRNANNTLLSQQLIGVRISILQADTAGQPVYVETHYTKTNLNGLMTLQIGGGLKFFGDFNSINWSTGRYFVKTETDPDGGFDYRITGYSELLSVPYALYAGGQTDTTNLIKRINTKLSITDTTSMLAPYAKKENFISKADLDSTNNFDINLKGNISSSKNVTVKGNIEALGSTSTLGTIDKPFKGLFLSAGSLSIASDTLGQNIPAAVLSNVEGNLQISAGGIKLLNDASFIARNIQGELEGNASTATTLKTPRKINGVAFDGSVDILIDNTNESYVKKESLNGTVPFNISIDGNFNSSKNVTVAGNIEALGSTSTLGTITKPFKGLYLSSGSLSIASDTLGQNVPAAVLSNVEGNLQISAGGVKLMGDNTSFIAPRIVGSLTGNATSATKLQTARTINNIPFDGSANITIATTSPNSITYTNTGTGDVPGGAYDGSLAKTISYNSIGASPLAGSSFITTVGTLSSGSIPFTLLSGTIPTWNQSTSGNAATATYATSAGSLSGTIPIWNQSTTGNAATATKLAATKNINGVAFDGSADISITTIADAGTLSGTTLNGTILNSSLTSVGTLANLTVTNPITGSVTGNAATANYATSAGSLSGTIPTWNQSTTGNAATATYATSAGTASKATILETARNINGVSFDGSADITISTTAPNSLTYNNSGIGDVSGGTYDGSLAKTISYNSVGASPLAGSASITTLGTIATGTWSATNIGIAHGGTNTNATPTSGAIIYGNGTSYAISAAGTSGQYLQSAGTGAPIWAQPGPASIQVLSSSGTYTTPAGVKVIIIELVGGGGGSGGINAPSNNQSTVSGGGGSGAYTRAIILNPNATYTFTIGIGGIASAAGSAGVAGGQTSFDGTNITAPGGLGGGAGSTTGTGTVSQGGLGGALGVGGAIMITGNSGGSGFSISSIAVSGAGANSYFGEGGVSRATASAVLAGAPGIGYGGGASGAAASTTTLAAGAAGFHGVIIVTEYK
ncbi:MAG: beta strand repeat-containing protein [Chitinophagaceae bacterium]